MRKRKEEMTHTPENEPDNNGDATATATAEPITQASEPTEDEAILFPELDTTDPKHKALLKAAKEYAKAKADRDALLSTSKEKVDSAGQKVVALMHECGLTKFKHKGVEAEVFTPEEKLTVEVESDDEADEN